MSKNRMISTLAVSLFMIFSVKGALAADTSTGKKSRNPAMAGKPTLEDRRAVRPHYKKDTVPDYCNQFLEDIVAAANWAGADNQPITDADRKNIVFSDVYSYGTEPCAGGADGCTVSNYKGKFKQEDPSFPGYGMEGQFVINAGRGNCILTKMSIEEFSPTHN